MRQLRSGWRAWVVLIVLVGVAGSVVLTATAGARRTDSAYRRFLDTAQAANVLVSPSNTGFGGYYRALAHLPDAETVAPVIGIQALPLRPVPTPVEAQVFAPSDGRLGHAIQRPRLVAGRFPQQTRVHEVALDITAARRLHAGIGDTIMLAATLSGPPPSGGGQAPPGLRVFRQRVVGVFVTLDNPVPITALAQLPVVFGTRALYDELGPSYRAFDAAYVRLRSGASPAQFGRQANALAQRYPATGGGVFVADLSDQAAQIERAIRPEAIALAIFAALVALTALVIISQSVLRQLRSGNFDAATLRALGLTRRQRWTISLLEVAVVATAGAVLAVVISILASPIMPLGAARLAEPHRGIDVDVATLGIGFLAIVALMVAATAWPSWRLSGDAQPIAPQRVTVRRRTWLPSLTRSPLPTTTVLGLHEAIAPGPTGRSVPVRSALVGTVVSILMVAGTLTFGANLVHLVDTPQLYGQTWQASIDTQFQSIPSSVMRTAVSRPGVVAWTPGNFGTVDAMDAHIPTIGLSHGKGRLVGPAVVSGRLPRRPGEIALGASTLRALDHEVGQDIAVQINGARRVMHIVGQAVFPAFDQGSFTATDLGVGAVVNAVDLVPPGTALADSYVFVLVRFAPGHEQADQVAQFGRASASFCAGVQQSTCFVTTQQPFDIGNYARIQDIPQILAVVLAVMGAAVLAQLVILWVRVRRREIAILKTLGFVRRQVVALFAWQASTLAVFSLLVGVPLGIAAGRTAWALFANELGIGTSSLVPGTRIALLIPAVLLIALVVAAVPAWSASRRRPGTALRSE